MHLLLPTVVNCIAKGVVLVRNRRAVAVMEFALVAPLLAILALGILNYGQYFLLAHSAQQIANDAARATIAGLSKAEREAIAKATVSKQVASLPIDASQVAVDVIENEASRLVTVALRVDASSNPMFKLKIVPMPDSTIERRGTVRQGGLD